MDRMPLRGLGWLGGGRDYMKEEKTAARTGKAGEMREGGKMELDGQTAWVLHNLVAHREIRSFPMVGKSFYRNKTPLWNPSRGHLLNYVNHTTLSLMHAGFFRASHAQDHSRH